jgi:Tfp pilus assembly protein PilV
MVEMLMAAFIMAIGLLGLAMLQTMALRSTTGSMSATSAILVAERVLDQAEALGRNSLLCSRTGNTVPTLNPNYFGSTTLTQNYNYDGTYNATASFYIVKVVPADVVVSVAGVGGIKLLTVIVTWNEGVNASNTVVPRNVTLSRRVSYATS